MAKKNMSKKSTGLVFGYLERISSNAFDQYSDVITEFIGGKNGIYALYRNQQLYYVGLAVDLRRRIKQHLKDRHAGKWNYFSLYLARSERFLKDLESLAIRVAFPKGNKVKGKFNGARNLHKLLRRRMKEKADGEITILIGKGHTKVAKKTAKKKKRKTTSKTKTEIPLKGLLSSKRIKKTYKGKEYKAWVLPTGRIKYNGQLFNSPSGVATHICKRNVNGWSFWYYRNKNGEWDKLKTLRE